MPQNRVSDTIRHLTLNTRNEVVQTTLNMIYRVIYYLGLQNAISIYYVSHIFLPTNVKLIV